MYYRCSWRKGRCPDKAVREEVVAEQFGDMLDALHFDPEALTWIGEELRADDKAAERERERDARRLQTELDRLQRRQETLYDDRLEGRIDVEFFGRMSDKMRNEEARIQDRLRTLEAAQAPEVDQAVETLELARNAKRLYDLQQDPLQKRRLLNFLCSNSTWKGGKLTVEYRQPFDVLAVAARSGNGGRGGFSAECPYWQAHRVSFRTLCLAPTPELRVVFEQLAMLPMAG